MDMLLDRIVDWWTIAFLCALPVFGFVTWLPKVTLPPSLKQALRWLTLVTILLNVAIYWIVPVRAIVYVASADPFESYTVQAGGETYCLERGTWRTLAWRLGVPETVTVTAATEGAQAKTYGVGPGTWFVNVGLFPVHTEWKSVVSSKGRNAEVIGGTADFSGPSVANVGEKPHDRYTQAYSRQGGGWNAITLARTGPCPTER